VVLLTRAYLVIFLVNPTAFFMQSTVSSIQVGFTSHRSNHNDAAFVGSHHTLASHGVPVDHLFQQGLLLVVGVLICSCFSNIDAASMGSAVGNIQPSKHTADHMFLQVKTHRSEDNRGSCPTIRTMAPVCLVTATR
jgi:hypothetical protein